MVVRNSFAALVFLALVILVGAVFLGSSLTGSFSPTEAAKAEGIRLQNPIDAERNKFDFEQEKAIQEAKTRAEIQRIAENERNTQRLNDQRIQQNARDFEQNSALKEWGVRTLVPVVAGVLAVLALAGMVRLGAGAWHSIAQAQTARQAARQSSFDYQQVNARLGSLQSALEQVRESAMQVSYQASIDGQRSDVLIRRFSQLNTRMDALENGLSQMRRDLKQAEVSLMETKSAVTVLQVGGNGKDLLVTDRMHVSH